MKVFTYNQYIKCIHTFRLNAVMQLAEESAEYNLSQSDKKYSHNKLIKNILQNQKEATEFINQFVGPREKVKEEQLIRYTNSYITKKYKSKEADLVYKLKNQEIFFLIEHQSTIDDNMPYRMLNYCLDIMREWSRTKKIGKNTSYPIVVPIVIYTGKQKWKMPTSFNEKQFHSYVYERYKMNMEYNFIDINRLSKQILLEKNTMFGYVMLIEKAENREELVENLNIIIKLIENKSCLEELANRIGYLLDNTLEDRIQQKLLRKIERKVGEKNMSSMSDLLDRLATQSSRDIQRGKEWEQRMIVENMLNLKLDEKIILEATKIKKQELEKIKSELVSAS